MNEQPATKKCTKCGLEKDLGEFHRDRSSKDGVRVRCKACIKEDSSKYRAENVDKISEYRSSPDGKKGRGEYRRSDREQNRR